MKGYTIQHSIDLLEKAVENSGGGSGGGGTAVEVSYSNTSSGLVATNVQSAIDEIDASVDTLAGDVTTLLNGHIYSETEQVIGKWIDGSDLYEKVVPIAAFPATPYTVTNYPHNIANLKDVIEISGNMILSSGTTYPINSPMFGGSGNNPTVSVAVISAYATSTDIAITTAVDRSAASGFVILRYTKTAPATNTRTKKK